MELDDVVAVDLGEQGFAQEAVGEGESRGRAPPKQTRGLRLVPRQTHSVLGRASHFGHELVVAGRADERASGEDGAVGLVDGGEAAHQKPAHPTGHHRGVRSAARERLVHEKRVAARELEQPSGLRRAFGAAGPCQDRTEIAGPQPAQVQLRAFPDEIGQGVRHVGRGIGSRRVAGRHDEQRASGSQRPDGEAGQEQRARVDGVGVVEDDDHRLRGSGRGDGGRHGAEAAEPLGIARRGRQLALEHPHRVVRTELAEDVLPGPQRGRAALGPP